MRYYMLNKPKGYVSACSDERCATVLSLFPDEIREGLFHVGRLDKNTEGLLLVTDDGEMCYRLLKPENEIPKSYICYVNGELSEEQIREVESGIKIYKNSESLTLPARVEILEKRRLGEIKNYLTGKDVAFANRKPEFPVTLVRVTITEGKKHQVKRMMGYMGTRVLYLKRLSMAGLSLDESLSLGEYRHLTDEEIEILRMNFQT